MMPQNTLSSQLVFGYYLPPDDRDPSKVVDYELGGIGYQDPSLGLEVQVWELKLKGILGTNKYGLYISAPNTPEIFMFDGTLISEAALAFDQNMNPFIAFVENGQAKIWWFDPTVSQMVTTNLPVGARSPKCTLDDKRASQTSTSDILVGYIRADNTLCFRMQRDRYLIEYPLQAGITLDLLRMGMTNKLRIQFAIGTMEEPQVIINYRVDTVGRQRVTVNGDKRRIVGTDYG